VSETTDLLARHASVRSFTAEPVSEADLAAVAAAARQSSSTCALQVVSVIRITDPEKRARLAELAGHQAHVAAAPEFWVFCADLARDAALAEKPDLGWTEQLLYCAVDAGIMGQSAMAALESLGLGGVFIGGIRNNIAEVAELLALPPQTAPLFGIAFGHPAQRNGIKPRLPASVTFMENRYRKADPAEMSAYDETMRRYYASRPASPKDARWSDEVRRLLARERRPNVLPFLQKQGFALK
jgi:nitroreductase